jgi:TonB family protein
MNVSRERARSFLAYGFGISIAVHALVLPFVHASKTYAEEPKLPDMRITHVPTPPPTPHPTPTPERTVPPTPPPHAAPHTPAPQSHAIRIDVPHTTAHGGGPVEAPNTHASGDPGGAPNAAATGAPAAAAPAESAPAPPAAATTPRATPTPLSCTRPNVPAATVRALEPETPAMAQQQGIAGTVNVIVSLDAQSRLVATRIQSSPSALLNAAALAAARGSQFRTEIKNCEPVAADYVFSVDFTAQ